MLFEKGIDFFADKPNMPALLHKMWCRVMVGMGSTSIGGDHGSSSSCTRR